MVDTQLAARGVRDRGVLEAMRRVPREEFVETGFEEFAYEDSPLPIGEGQTISQPYIVALMIEAAEVKPGDRVLEVGTGSGYAAAVMSMIAEQLYTIERHEALGMAVGKRFKELGYENVEHRIGDGAKGWPEAAPFDAIIVAAGEVSVRVLRRRAESQCRSTFPSRTCTRSSSRTVASATGGPLLRHYERGPPSSAGKIDCFSLPIRPSRGKRLGSREVG